MLTNRRALRLIHPIFFSLNVFLIKDLADEIVGRAAFIVLELCLLTVHPYCCVSAVVQSSSRECVRSSLSDPERRLRGWPLCCSSQGSPCCYQESYPGKPACLWGEFSSCVALKWISSSNPERCLSREPVLSLDEQHNYTVSGVHLNSYSFIVIMPFI